MLKNFFCFIGVVVTVLTVIVYIYNCFEEKEQCKIKDLKDNEQDLEEID